jgi:hypothetical protein
MYLDVFYCCFCTTVVRRAPLPSIVGEGLKKKKKKIKIKEIKVQLEYEI